jgi:hypothetical protein
MDGIIENLLSQELDFNFVEIHECSLLLKQIESGQKNSNSPIKSPHTDEDMTEVDESLFTNY